MKKEQELFVRSRRRRLVYSVYSLDSGSKGGGRAVKILTVAGC